MAERIAIVSDHAAIETARDCVDQFLAAPFAGGRRQRPVGTLSNPDFAEEPA